eukprot:1137757-Pelagomonas_calceolata.AAC.3
MTELTLFFTVSFVKQGTVLSLVCTNADVEVGPEDVLGSPTLQQPSRVVEPRFDPNVGVPVSLLGSQPFEGDNGEGSPPAAAPAATASMATKFVVDQEEEAQVPLAGNLQVQTHYQIQQLEQQGHVLLQGQQQQQLIGEQGQWVEQHQLQEQEHQQQQQDPDEEHFPQQDPAWHGENTQQEQQERQQDQEPVDLDDVPLIERARMLSLAARKKQSAGCQDVSMMMLAWLYMRKTPGKKHDWQYKPVDSLTVLPLNPQPLFVPVVIWLAPQNYLMQIHYFQAALFTNATQAELGCSSCLLSQDGCLGSRCALRKREGLLRQSY